MDSVAMLRVQMAVILVLESSGIEVKSIVQIPDQGDLLANSEDKQLMTASSRADLHINSNRKDDTRKSEKSRMVFFRP